MTRSPAKLEVSMHEAAHAVVQLATRPSSYTEFIFVAGLPGGTLGLIQTELA